MKSLSKCFIAMVLGINLITSISPVEAAAVQPGQICKKVNTQTTSKGINFKCTKVGTKLRWLVVPNPVVQNVAPNASPTPQKIEIPATCKAQPPENSFAKFADPDAQGGSVMMGFYVSNSSPDRDATDVRIKMKMWFRDGTPAETQFFEISRIPAGQSVGVGKIFDTASPTFATSQFGSETTCKDSPKASTLKLLEISGNVYPQDNSSPFGLTYSGTLSNTYPSVLRCKNDKYSCMVYVLFYDLNGRTVGGDTLFLGGPIFPSEPIKFQGYIDDWPRIWNPRYIASFTAWIQEPQS